MRHPQSQPRIHSAAIPCPSPSSGLPALPAMAPPAFATVIPDPSPVPAAQPEHALYCFDVLSHRLHGHQDSSSGEGERLEPRFHNGNDIYPLFVTWNIKSRSATSKEYRLRGCIGNFSGMPLTQGLQDYALISAFKDDRFDPIELYELQHLQCGVSLLTDFEDCDDAFDWELGKHGIWIHLSPPSTAQVRSDKKSRFELSATFLPDVPGQCGWTQRQTLEAAIRKAGYQGKVDKALLDQLRVRRYQSSKVTVTYEDWKQARNLSIAL